jgi:hypothetical protein
MTHPYFDELTRSLRGRGLPENEITRTVADLAAFAAESGTDPEQEFGTPDAFAAQLAGEGERASAAAAPPAEAETWTWRADAFHEREVLDRYGDEGWEVERVDAAGRFVSRRAADRPLRWEYRRETVLPRNRAAVEERLAPEGWEPCGTWFHYEYFKRPKAATLGLEGELDASPEVPAKATYWSKRFYLFVAGYFAFIAALCTAWVVLAPDDSHPTFIAGCLTGGVVALVLMGLRRWQTHRAQ